MAQKTKIKANLKRIAERKKEAIEREDPYFYLTDKMLNLLDLTLTILKIDIGDIKTNQVLKQNLVSLITIFEVFLKEFFIFLIDDLEFPLNDLVFFKMPNLNSDELVYIKNNNITDGEILAEPKSFQNIDTIDSCYSKIFGYDFINKLENTQFHPSIPAILNKPVNIKENLRKIIKYRHRIIHSRSSNIFFSKIEFISFFNLIIKFTGGIFSSTFEELLKRSEEFIKEGNNEEILKKYGNNMLILTESLTEADNQLIRFFNEFSLLKKKKI